MKMFFFSEADTTGTCSFGFLHYFMHRRNDATRVSGPWLDD